MPDGVTGKVPILACVRSSWLFLAQNFRRLLPAAIITAMLSEVGVAATVLMTPAGQAAPISIVTIIPGVIAGLMFSAAVLRLAVRNEYVAPLGLTLGGDEGRLFGLGVSAALVAIPLVFLVSILIFMPIMGRIAQTPEAMEALSRDPEAMNQALVQALGPTGMAALEIGGLAVYCLALGLIAFLQAATIGEKRIVLFQALRWTGGNFFRVLAAIVLTVAPTVAAVLLLGFVATPLIVDVVTLLVVQTIAGVIENLVMIPVIALGAMLYKGLRPPDFVAK